VSAMLPIFLLPIAGVLALVLVWPRVRTPISLPRLFLEAVGMVLLAVGILWAAWVVLWFVEQRW
jgi:hypothetical protein